jgi:hypothetical protein
MIDDLSTPAPIAYAGEWRTQQTAVAVGSSRHYTSKAGYTATLTVTDTSSVAWVSSIGPNRGKAQMYVDGVLVRNVDLYSPDHVARQVVATFNGLPAGNHEVEIRVRGTKNAASSGKRVDVDAFVIID